MQERLSDAWQRDCIPLASTMPENGVPRRVMKIELLLGGIRLPGTLEYHAGADQVTLTIERFSRSTPDEI